MALPFHVIAHRGASAYAPENTLPAFERARDLGAREVELDVRLSRDRVVVLFHDSSLDEKTDLSGRVQDHAAEVLLRADIGSWFDAAHPDVDGSFAGTPLATLAQVFERFGETFHYHVEMKSEQPSLPGRILELARAHSLESRLTLTSFHLESLRRARELDSRVRLAWLRKQPAVSWMDRAAGERFDMIAFPAAVLDADLVRHAHHRGLEIRAFRVKTGQDMERVIRSGANGMTIDWPERLLQRLAEISRTHTQDAP